MVWEFWNILYKKVNVQNLKHLIFKNVHYFPIYCEQICNIDHAKAFVQKVRFSTAIVFSPEASVVFTWHSNGFDLKWIISFYTNVRVRASLSAHCL